MTEQIETNSKMVEAQPTVQYEKIEKFDLKPAGFWIRFWAYLFDLLVVSAITGILVNPIFHVAGWSFDQSEWYAPIALLSSLIFYTYFVIMTKLANQTVGKMIFGIRVMSKKEEKLSWGTVLFREFIGRFFSTTIPMLYWIVGFTPNKIGVHDYVADTFVVHEKTYEKRIIVVKRKTDSISQLQQPETF